VLRRKTSVPQKIREAIDTYPGGICFAMTSGRPILVNRKMNELILVLTGHTILDETRVWEELSRFAGANGCERLERPWDEGESGTADGQLGFRFPDGRVWRFQREYLLDRGTDYVQLEASDITDLYRLSEELCENNRRLSGLRARQKKLLGNIVQINREKELLDAKMRVHDEFGRCLIATKKALSEETLSRDVAEISKAWEDAIRGLTNIPLEQAETEISQEAELLQVADMIGCRIVFDGARPSEKNAQRLLYAAVREALTNAVRHAGADRLTVAVRATESGWRAEISDNGRADVRAIREGDGLRGLRSRLEQEGATLEIRCAGGVGLVVEIPSGGEQETGGETHDERPAG